MAHGLGKTATRFAENRRGNFAVMMAAVCSVVALSAGYGINIAQLSLTRSNLLNALDAAVTSTARDITTGVIAEKDVRASVEAFLHANGGTGFAAAERISLDSLEIDKAARTVRASASVMVDLAFPLFGAERARRVSTESAAVYSDRKIEIAMMLDVTGSMEGQKLRDLKTAAKNAVGTLLGGQKRDKPRIRIALVPYADAVNTGSLSNTVYAERSSRSPSEPPRLEAPRAASARAADRCATEREASYQFSDASPYTAMVNRDYRLAFCPDAKLRPLTADAKVLVDAIDDFRAAGHTAGPVGVQWAWYMLSPRWAEVLPASARPARNDAGEVAKYAILMTDGEFNTAYANVPDGGNTRAQPGRSRDHAERLCREMKKQGIEIFTIGFKLQEREAKEVMKDCASPDAGPIVHYFEADSGAELNDAYQQIARNIERLALTR